MLMHTYTHAQRGIMTGETKKIIMKNFEWKWIYEYFITVMLQKNFANEIFFT